MNSKTFEKTMKWMLRIIVVELAVLALVLISLGVVAIVNRVQDNTVTSNHYENQVEHTSKKPTSKPAENKPSYTEEDVELLARLIYGEARGECYEGQVAVGAVVVNRVKSKGFPNTLEGVIYQKRQFSCVDDGQFDLPIPENSSVYKAARAALEGEDPTNGCTYFYNPKIATNSWVFENTVTKVVIGNHNFAVDK